jgi:hypothetical protein
MHDGRDSFTSEIKSLMCDLEITVPKLFFLAGINMPERLSEDRSGWRVKQKETLLPDLEIMFLADYAD